MIRCPWCLSHPLYIDYHDNEWGKPLHDDRRLFELLILEGAQAGLSWLTVLKKRENYRKAFDGFDAQKIAQYGPRKVKSLLADVGIIRNRLKIAAAIDNAKVTLALRKERGSLDAYLWSFVGEKTIINHPKTMKDIPAKSKISDAMSKDLKARGFRFAGSTICYAFMQAAGLVDDHLSDCYLRKRNARS